MSLKLFITELFSNCVLLSFENCIYRWKEKNNHFDCLQVEMVLFYWNNNVNIITKPQTSSIIYLFYFVYSFWINLWENCLIFRNYSRRKHIQNTYFGASISTTLFGIAISLFCHWAIALLFGIKLMGIDRRSIIEFVEYIQNIFDFLSCVIQTNLNWMI